MTERLHPDALLLPFAFALGLVVGSFLNVVVHRLPEGLSVVRPRSRCPACGAPIAARDNVPLLSWLWLRGRCRRCRAPIALRYPLLELVTGALFAAIALRFGAAPTTPLWWAFAAALVAVAAIDADHQVIPDEISLGGLAAGLALVPPARALAGAPLGAAFLDSVLGALVGGGLLWSVGFVHARLAVARGRTFPHWPGAGEAPPGPRSLDYWTWFPGLGFGDVKLMAMIGAFLGPLGVLEALFAAALVGLVLGLGYAVARGSFAVPFGFGPALAAGALAVLLSPVHWIATP